MVELPKTEEELTSLIKSEVEKATADLVSKHNGAMAKVRTDYDARIKALKEENELGKEEYAKKKLQEQQEADQQELSELRSFKKEIELEKRLAKEGLPNHFKYDSRLLNASEDNLDKVLKSVKSEYEQTLPKGNQHSSVVQVGGQQPTQSDKDKANQAFGQALKELVG